MHFLKYVCKGGDNIFQIIFDMDSVSLIRNQEKAQQASCPEELQSALITDSEEQ